MLYTFISETINVGLVTTQRGYFDYPVNSTVGILNTL